MTTVQLDPRELSSLRFAYSLLDNPYRFESHLYAFWLLVAQRIIPVSKQDRFIIVPQMMAYYPRGIRHKKKFSPDFVVANTPSASENSVALINWNSLSSNEARTQCLALVEVKRMPPRGLNLFELFIRILHTSMAEAQGQLYDFYAPAYFRTHPGDFLVLIAAVGEWWSYRLVLRKDIPVTDLKDGLYGDEVASGLAGMDDEFDDNGTIPSLDDALFGQTLSNATQCRYVHETLQHRWAEPLIDPNSTQDWKAKTEGWSGYLLVGTNTSDFHLDKIRKLMDENSY